MKGAKVNSLAESTFTQNSYGIDDLMLSCYRAKVINYAITVKTKPITNTKADGGTRKMKKMIRNGSGSDDGSRVPRRARRAAPSRWASTRSIRPTATSTTTATTPATTWKCATAVCDILGWDLEIVPINWDTKLVDAGRGRDRLHLVRPDHRRAGSRGLHHLRWPTRTTPR